MATDLMMPALSPTMEKGTLARWLVAVGDTVKPGDLLAEIETDKATMEFEAIDDGIVSEIVIQEGTDDVAVGTIIARLSGINDVTPAIEKILSPSARRAAKDTGRDPAKIEGTGRKGRVTKEDILSDAAVVEPQEGSIDVAMPALSPTMEKGTIARWLIAVGDQIQPGDLIAEIETDKATMELEAAAEGTLAEILWPAGSEDIAVGTTIARVSNGAETRQGSAAVAAPEPPSVSRRGEAALPPPHTPAAPKEDALPPEVVGQDASGQLYPLIRRIAAAKSIDLNAVTGSGPNGRIVLADIVPSSGRAAPDGRPVQDVPARDARATLSTVAGPAIPGIPYESAKLSGMRKTIARRLTESKQQIPHIYLTVDVRLDAVLRLRGELNAALEPRGVRLSVNDMIIKAQALALLANPACNVQYTSETLIRFSRVDIAVAVSIPDGLITPIIVDAGSASLSSIATSMKTLAARARDGKLQPSEYQGGTASLSNLGMYGIKQFDAVINPPQAMILAVGAGEQRTVVEAGDVAVGTVMTATGSFDHRAIDGADAAAFMAAFRAIVENPLQLLG